MSAVASDKAWLIEILLVARMLRGEAGEIGMGTIELLVLPACWVVRGSESGTVPLLRVSAQDVVVTKTTRLLDYS